MTLAEIDAMIRQGKEAPLGDVPMFRKIMRATRLPLPLRRFAWWVGLSFGRQRANWFGNFSVTSVAACGGGELLALSPGPFIINFDLVQPDQTIRLLIRWDHRVTDGDRKSTRLNSSHQISSYAVFCLKKKIMNNIRTCRGRSFMQCGIGLRTVISKLISVLFGIQWRMICRGCFFFNDTATTEIYTLSLHDALPI